LTFKIPSKPSAGKEITCALTYDLTTYVYGFGFDDTKYYYWYDGIPIEIGTYNAGDVFTLSITSIGGYWYKNGVQVHYENLYTAFTTGLYGFFALDEASKSITNISFGYLATGPTGPTGPQGQTGPNSFNTYTLSPTITTNTTINPASDYNVYQIDTTSNIITITLPSTSGLSRIYIFSDIGGNLINNNIILQTDGSDTIAGQSSFTANINYSSIQIISNTISKWLVI
jgi:hypothetical protein